MLAMLLCITFGLALVLILRRPMRRLFGATPAFTLWLLPPTLALLPWLPEARVHWLEVTSLQVFPAAQILATQVATTTSFGQWPCLLWGVGSMLCMLRLALHYCQLLYQNRPLPQAMLQVLQTDWPNLDPHRLRLHPAGPALLWAPRSLVLLPNDFLQQFDADQRRLVLQHELTHLQRGDALWSLLGELMLALLWFHPLAWLALPRLRLDQELACDECVLSQSPQDEAAYAHTLLHSNGVDAMPMFIPWLTQPQLKERLKMIQRPRAGILRRRIGFTILAAVMAGGVFVAQAAVQHQSQTASADLSYSMQRFAHYPETALKNKEAGTVVLMILVGKDGTPLTINVDPATKAAPDLIKAAGDAAMHWRFNPTIVNGKAVEGYARVPVMFKLDKLPSATPPSSSSTRT